MLPDGQHARPHLGSNVVVLEVFTIVTRRAGVDLGAGTNDGDPEDGSALQLGFCRWHARVVPPIGNETVRDAVHGPILLIFVRNEVRVTVENCAAVVAAMVEGRQGEFEAV